MNNTERALRVVRRGEQSPIVMDAFVFAGVYRLGRDVVVRDPEDSDTICLFVGGKMIRKFDAASAVAVAFRRRRARERKTA